MLTPWLVSGGLVALLTLLARVFLKLHNDAVDAERRRADDWREAHKAEVARGEVRDRQLEVIMSALKREPV